MHRPPIPHMMGPMYHSPTPHNNHWRPRGPRPQTGFQWRPNFRAPFTDSSIKNNEEHWCETCDRGFPTEDLLLKHKQQHQKCNIDGCQFVAHPKVITKHIQMQHSSGLYKKIAKLDNPEDIQKWREERKKKYPTRVNIEKKAAEVKEKIERGEKMSLKYDRHNNKKSTDQTTGTKRKHSFDNRNLYNNKTNFHQRMNQCKFSTNKDQPPANKIPRVIPKVPHIIEKNKLKPFTGILSISMVEDVDETGNVSNSDNSLIEDDDEETKHPEEKSDKEPTLCGALTMLMCDYGSSDEEIDDKDNKVMPKKNVTLPVKNQNNSGVNNEKDRIYTNGEKSVNTVINTNTVIKSMDTVIETSTAKEADYDHMPQIVDNKSNHKDENSEDDSGPEEVKTIKGDNPEPSFSQKEFTKQKNPSQKRNTPRKDHREINKYRHKVPSTLLQKLLRKEIRQERNIVLQCIRYIKKNNYFDKIE